MNSKNTIKCSLSRAFTSMGVSIIKDIIFGILKFVKKFIIVIIFIQLLIPDSKTKAISL